MDGTLSHLLAELDSLGIEAREDGGKIYLRPAPPPSLRHRLSQHREALAQALWARAGRAKQEAAIARLLVDRQAWIAENKQLGLYRGPG